MKWKGLAIGQVLALLYLGTGVFSELLLDMGVSAPVFQNVWMYAALAVLYWTKLSFRVRKGFKLHWREAWKYALASVSDSQCNFLDILSYQYTSLTCVFILGNSSVMMVCLLSVVFLKRRYGRWEWLGVALSLIGIVATVLGSLLETNWQFEGKVLGDVIVLLGTLLYAVTNVWAEYLFLHGADPDEYLAGLGTGGCIFSLIESLGLELAQIRSAPVSSAGYFSGYTLCLAGMYTICPYYFTYFSAVMYNLSLLTTVGYGLIVSVFLFHEPFVWLDIVAYVFVILGLASYGYQPKKSEKEEAMAEVILQIQE